MSKESFISFVKTKPNLANYVNNNQMTWQKFYEMYELYGENNEIWKNYEKKITTNDTSQIGFKDIFGMFKKMDPNDIQKGLNSVQKGIEFVQGLIVDKKTPNLNRTTPTYEPRPRYKFFDD